MTQYFTAYVGTRHEFEAHTLDALRKKVCDYYLEDDERTMSPEVDKIIVHENDEETELDAVRLDNFNDDLDDDFQNALEDADAQQDHERYLRSMPGRL